MNKTALTKCQFKATSHDNQFCELCNLWLKTELGDEKKTLK